MKTIDAISGDFSLSAKLLGDLDDARTWTRKMERAAALIYYHFRKEFGMPRKHE